MQLVPSGSAMTPLTRCGCCSPRRQQPPRDDVLILNQETCLSWSSSMGTMDSTHSASWSSSSSSSSEESTILVNTSTTSSSTSSSSSSSSPKSKDNMAHATTTATTTTTTTTKKGRLSVRFDQDANQTYATCSLYDNQDLWYTEDELQDFRQQANNKARFVILGTQGKVAREWYQTVCQAYQESSGSMAKLPSSMTRTGRCLYDNDDDDDEGNAPFLGLELWAFKPLKVDRRRRRMELWSSILYWQSLPEDVNATARARQIRKSSLALSHTARVFAMHMGTLAAAAATTTTTTTTTP